MKPFSSPVFRLWLSAVLVLAALAMPARLVYGGPLKPAAASASGSIAAGRLLVKFREEATAETTDGVFVASGLAVQRHLEGLNVYVVDVPEGKEMSFAEQLGRQPAIAYAEPDYIMEASGVPNDPSYATEQWNLPHVNAPAAWDITTGVSDVIIAILDTGVDLSHPDLASKIVEGYDFINGDAIPQDDNGHGTAVAGVAAAVTDNAEGVAGVAWGARIMPVKVLDSSGWGYYSGVADGIRWAADHGAQIIELGLGGYDPSSTLEVAVNYAYERGVLIVAAAGNDYLQGNRTLYPAAYPHVLAVTATNDMDERARYSNTGAYIDIAAPGGDPEDSGDANPRHWITSTLWDGGSTYGPRAGTSMASAHIAGTAALVWSLHPSWTNDQVEGVIEATALDRGAPGRDDVFGWGRIDMAAAVAADAPPTCLADSSHPYSNNLDQTWAITNPDTDVAISRVHFSRLETESIYDFVKVKDGDGTTIQTFNGSYAGGLWSEPVPGRTVQIQLVSDYIVSAWGFCVDQIETVAYAPDIDVPAAPISVRLGPGQTTNRTVVIGNTGRGALDFSLSVADATTPGSDTPESRMEAPATSEEASASVAPFRLVHAEGDIYQAPPSQLGAPQDVSAYPSGSWGLGAPMSASRYRFAGVTDNWRRYFAIGGSDMYNDLAFNQVYDPVADSWTALAPMPTARMNVQAASLGGMLYVPGGYLASSQTILSVHEAYDIVRNTWTTKAPLPQPLAGAMVTSAGGKVYAFGGASANGIEASTYQYDPGADTWSTRSAMPAALAFGGAVEHGGHIYVMTGAATYYDLSPAFLRYDLASDSWATGPPLNIPRNSPAVITAGEYVYVLGGGGCGDLWDPCGTVERYYLPAFPNGDWEIMGDAMPAPAVGTGYACTANRMWLGGGDTGYDVTNLNQYLDEGLACGDAAWLSVKPTSGDVPAGSSLSVTLTFAATDLEIGSYRANLIITSNDSDETQITVPVTLQVATTRSVYLPWIAK